MATSGHIRLFKLTLATLCLCIGTFRSVPTQPQFSTAFNSALTERKQPGQTWLCLLLWFCSIILFPLLVVTYWSFIKTKWVRFQPGSINCPCAILRENQSQLSFSCSPFLHFSPFYALISTCCFLSYLFFLCYSLALSFSLEKERSLIAV